MKIERNTIQILRAFAIVLVVIHHTFNNLPGVNGGVVVTISQSDVAIFFMISGYLFEMQYGKYSRDKTSFIRRKAKQLLIRYLFWSLILYIGAGIIHLFGGRLSGILTNLGFEKLSVPEIAINILTFRSYYVEYLWFVYVLFIYFIIHIFCGKQLKQWWMPIVALLVAGVIKSNFELPYILWKILQHFSDFLVGRVLFEAATNINNCKISWRRISIVSSCLSIGLVVAARLIANSISGGFQIIIATIINHLMYWVIAVALLCFIRYLGEIKIGNAFKTIGDYSYDIYLMHTPYVVPVIARLTLHYTGNNLAAIVLSAVCGILIPMLISSLIIRRIKLLRGLALGI